MDRRRFLRGVLGAGGAAVSSRFLGAFTGKTDRSTARVAFVKTTDRAEGVRRAVALFGLASFHGRDLFVKPNFNSSDPPPGSTHMDTLTALLQVLKEKGAGKLTIGDRSGMGDTRQVMGSKGAFDLAKAAAARAVVLDELAADDWEVIKTPGTHWQRGFAFPRMLRSELGVVQTCNLKTHRYGGHFTLSLKNSVGLAAKFVPGDSYNYMHELHSSPHQRHMIAEINAAYHPELVVLDGVEAFVNGGPDTGQKVQSSVVLAGTDRIAIDAVGVAILRHFGTTPEVSKGPIFEQEQLARAVELGLGVSSPAQIELVTDDAASREYAKQIRDVLDHAA